MNSNPETEAGWSATTASNQQRAELPVRDPQLFATMHRYLGQSDTYLDPRTNNDEDITNQKIAE